MFTKSFQILAPTAARGFRSVVTSEHVELLKMKLNMQRIANSFFRGREAGHQQAAPQSLPPGFVRPAPFPNRLALVHTPLTETVTKATPRNRGSHHEPFRTSVQTELLLLNRILGAVGKHYEHPITKQLLFPWSKSRLATTLALSFTSGMWSSLPQKPTAPKSAPLRASSWRSGTRGQAREHAQHAVIWLEKKMIPQIRASTRMMTSGPLCSRQRN